MACGTQYTAPAANAWVAGSYVAAPGQINGVQATTDVFRLTGVMVLPGSEVPPIDRAPLIMRPYDQELSIVRRYFEIVGMTMVTTNPPYANTAWYRSSKRISPTITPLQSLNGATVGVASYSPLEGMRQIGVASAPIDASFSIDARL
jgi:hypothetical protein